MTNVFDHVNAIYTDQRINYFDDLDEEDQKTFNNYMVNRIISMNPDYIPIVNEFQRFYGELRPREVYLFYSQLLPKKKQFNKYIKGKKEIRYEDWLIDILVTYYNISKSEAVYYLSIFYNTDEGKRSLKSICEKFGIDPKTIKEAKL